MATGNVRPYDEYTTEDISQLTRYLEKVNISPATCIRKFDNLDLIGEPITDINNASSERLNTYVLSQLLMFQETSDPYVEADLMAIFSEDFSDWEVKHFATLIGPVRRALRTYLMSKGIYICHQNGPINTILAALVTSPGLPEWNNDELLALRNLDKNAFITQRRRNELLKKNPAVTVKDEVILLSPPPVQQSTSPVPEPVEPSAAPGPPGPPGPSAPSTTPGPPELYPVPSPIPKPSGPSASSAYPGPSGSSAAYPVPVLYAPVPTSATYDPYTSLPPHPYPNERLDSSKLSQFTKTYDKDNKYTGDPYDLIDDKMRIFLNLCYHMEIKPTHYFHAF